mmetsp:Transcript_4244/g.8574  ORF Transcript_4244/g.8574 Transcript_4244/m.8574 type:complete len:100 (+) Transcript_4244:326-625(+)
MQDDDSFLKATYTIHLQRSKGLGDGVRGYGLQFEPRQDGPTVTKVFQGGEAHRSGLVQNGDVLVEVNGEPVQGKGFMQAMDKIVENDSCSFTFAGQPVS